MATIADVVNKAKKNLASASSNSNEADPQQKKDSALASKGYRRDEASEADLGSKRDVSASSVGESVSEAQTDSISSPENIEYTKTRIIPVSSEQLAANRVIAQNKEDPRSTPFHMLRAKVLRELRENNWNTIAISAPTPGAGKSLVTVNLAMSIAMEVNQTVLIVDMDLRQPSLHKYFSIDPDFGVQDYIQSDVEIEKMLINPGVERLSLLPGRKRLLNSSEKLASPKIKALTEELKTRYESRIVIYDLPPLLVSDDVMVFLPYVDCSLLVVESGVNTQEEIEASMKLAEVKPLLGTVLNKDIQHKKIYVY